MTSGGSRGALVVAALVSVTYFSTLLDTPRRTLIVMPAGAPVQPPVPEDKGPRARLTVEITDEQGALVRGASVSVYALRGAQAYAAGLQLTDERGLASLDQVPPGEVWVLAEAPGRQRSSTRLVLGAAGGSAKLVLRRAQRLAVQVVDESDRAVVGASVEVRSGDPLPHVGTSGADGAVEFARLGPGPWSVRATATGYESAARSGVSAGLLPQRLTLRSLGVIEVTVLDPAGSPAAGATVEVAGSGLWPARTAAVGEDGKVRIAAIPAGAYNVTASRGDLVSETSLGTLVRRGEPTQLSLRLGPGRRVAVRVVDGEGEDARPVPRAEVVLAEEGISSFPRRGVTGPDGEVTLGPIGVHTASVGARAPGFVPRSGVRVAPDAAGVVTVALMRGGVVVGEVVDGGGYPIGGASIEIIGVDFAGMPVDETPEHMSFRDAHFSWALSTPVALIPAGELGVMPGPVPPIPHGKTALVAAPMMSAPPGAPGLPLEPSPAMAPWVSGSDGRFRVGPVPPGRLRALVRHPSYVEALSEAVTIAPGGEGKVRVQLRAGGTLEGRVVDGSGHPLAGARVEISAVHGATVRSVLTADDGTFAFAAVPGEVSVSVARPATFDEVAKRLTVVLDEGERKEVEISLPDPREPVEVRVVDDRGYPLDNAQVTVLSLAVASPLRATRFTRGDGVASLPDAAGLPLRIEVSLGGYAPRVETVDASPREVRVALGKAASVEGEVTARGGRESVEGATVTVHIGSVTRSERTGSDGRYTLRGLPPGAARLVVQARGYARAERAIKIPEPDHDRPASLDRVDLVDGGEVEGEVVDRNGDPVVGARVAAGLVPAFLPLGPLPPGIALTDARGRFKLGDLPEGGVTLEAFAPDRGRGRAQDVRVIAGRTLRGVRITLDTETSQSDPAGSGGVAVTLGEVKDGGRTAIVVRAVAAGSEAERAGIEVDDELLRVDDHEPTSLEDARRRLSGPASDDVVLRLRRRGEEVRLRVARERVRR